MERILVYAGLFVFGGIAYVLLEYVWRGHSHWTMAVAGGLALVLLYGAALHLAAWPLLLKCWVGAIIIASVEFVTGAVVNVRLKWNVWDYSARRCNLYGQVCLTYFFLWGLLCVPVFAFLDALQSLW